MECLAAACEWLCPSASPPAPARPGARREKFLDRTVEWGPWQGANSPGPEHQVSETETTLPADDSHEVNELHKSEERTKSPASDQTMMGYEVASGDDLQPFAAYSEESEVECEEEPLLRDVDAPDTQIILNVYDVSNSEVVQWINAFFAYEHAPFKLAGVFHVGVQVGDEEWAFGATRRGTGVWRQKPRSTEQHHFRQSIVMGSATLPAHGLEVMYRLLGSHVARPQLLPSAKQLHTLCQRGLPDAQSARASPVAQPIRGPGLYGRAGNAPAAGAPAKVPVPLSRCSRELCDSTASEAVARCNLSSPWPRFCRSCEALRWRCRGQHAFTVLNSSKHV